MGQYHLPVNIDKREYLYPHLFGAGLKMLEWGTGGGVTTALTVLLACSHNRGGGDLRLAADIPIGQGDGRICGRWAGDRIIVLGDDTEPGDPGTIPLYEMAEAHAKNGILLDPTDPINPFSRPAKLHPYSFVEKNFTDISMAVREVIKQDRWVAGMLPAEVPDYLSNAAEAAPTLSELAAF